MDSGGNAASRGRHLLRITLVLGAMFTAGLMAAGVVAGAGPLAMLSDPTTTESATDPGTTSTESTTDSETTTESTSSEPTTTGTETTTTESTTTESTTTESTPAPSGPPTITSEQPDYAPGATVTLMGTNWAAGEAVHLFVNDDKAKTWSYNADITADADGRFMNQFQLPASFVAVYTVTARGPTSGIATTSFTDASLSVAASPTGVTFALTYQGFSDSTCTNPINGSNGQPQPQSVTAGTNFQVTFGSAAYEKLTAGSASAPTGATFSSWTGPSSFNSPNATVCVATPSGGNDFAYMATYATVQTTSLNVASATGTYGGTVNLSATLTVGSSGVGGKTVGFKLNGNSVGSAVTNGSGVASLASASLTGINTSTYAAGVQASFAGDSSFSASNGSNVLTVNQASSTTTVTCPSSVTYNGSAQTPCSASVIGAGGLGLNPTPSYSGNTDAGHCHGVLHLHRRRQPHGQQRLEELQHRPGKSRLQLDRRLARDLRRRLAHGERSCKGIGGGELAGLDLSGTAHTNAGDYPSDPWSFAQTTNYNAANGTVHDQIDRANPDCSSIAGYHVTYDGDSHTASGSCKGIGGGELAGLDLSGTAHTNAGDYPSDPWSFAQTTNYNAANGTVHDQIDRANPDCSSIAGYHVTYDGDSHTASGSCKGIGGGELAGLDLIGHRAYQCRRRTGATPGRSRRRPTTTRPMAPCTTRSTGPIPTAARSPATT